MSQQTLSNWSRTIEPSLDQLVLIEKALDLGKGWLLRAAGYIDDAGTLRMIDTDPNLSHASRDLLMKIYRAEADATSPAASKAVRTTAKDRDK